MEKVFMDFCDDDFFMVDSKSAFDGNSFVNSLGNMDKICAFDILEKIRYLELENRKIVFDDERIRNKLRYGLLEESKFEQFYSYRKILSVITPSEFLSLYDSSFLKEFFEDDIWRESVFFAALCEKDINQVVEYILQDNTLFEEFYNCSKNFDSFFSELDYDLFKKIIIKMQDIGLECNDDILNNVNIEYQYRIIKEPEINDDTLVSLLSSFRNVVKSDFFKNDSRASYLYTKFNINSLIKKGIKFSDDILAKKDFFELLKSDSIIEFRTNINNVEEYNNPVIIEKRVEEYYNEILSFYNSESNLFNVYEIILNNPGKYKINNSYIFDFEIVHKINSHLLQDENGLFYYKDRDSLLKFLKDETSKKLSEVIIDALFRDNIYNVWINIKEMIRYNSLLDENSKIMDREKEDFYKMILNFDKVDNLDKIILFNKLKDRNFSTIFYCDLRKVKDAAYDGIKNMLISPSLHPEYIDKVSSDKYGVQVYDLRDKEYTMLVSTQDDFREIERYRRNCYSIISNENTQVFGEYDNSSFLYGYDSFENDRVLHMFESDSFSSNYKSEGSRYVNRIMTSEELVKANSGYSEIQLVNVKSDNGKYKYIAKRPDFIVTFNHIENRHVEESKRLNIPIVVISKKKIDKKDINFDIGVDAYVKNFIGEKEHRVRR